MAIAAGCWLWAAFLGFCCWPAGCSCSTTEQEDHSGQQHSWSYSSSDYRKLTNQTDQLDYLLSVKPPKKRQASPPRSSGNEAPTLLDSENSTLPATQPAVMSNMEEEAADARSPKRRDARPPGGDDLEAILRRVIKEECGVRLSAVENTVREHEDRLLKLEAAVGGNNRGSWATGQGTSVAGSAASASSRVGSADFVPSYIELRGWSTWEERNQKGVRREEDVSPFMVALKEHMPSSYHDMLGPAKLFGARNIKVQIPVKPGMAWELRGVVMDAIQHGGLSLGGVTPRVTVEDSPLGLATKITLGKLMDGAKALLTEKNRMGWTVAPDWKAKAVMLVSQGQDGEHEVAHVSESGLPIFAAEAIQLVFGASVAEYERKYAQARRR